MISAEATSTVAESSQRTSAARVQAPSRALIDNIMALISIGLVAVAAAFAVHSWTEITPIRVILFASLYMLMRTLIRHLFELKARFGLS